MKQFVAATVILGGALTAGSAIAHHSFAAEFNRQQPVELQGIVTKVEWTNPHVWVYINVRDEESGEMVNWGGEFGPPHGLQRRGWRRDTLSIGTRVTVNDFLARNGSKRVNVDTITLTATGNRPGQTLDADSSANKAN